MENNKVANHIYKIRTIATEYKAAIEKMVAASEEWEALYGTLVDEDSFSGENLDVIPTGDPATRTASISTVVSNFGTIASGYDSGYDTSFAKITV